jgi:hypothetical protein
MSQTKAELTIATLQRDWPHHVALQVDEVARHTIVSYTLNLRP